MNEQIIKDGFERAYCKGKCAKGKHLSYCEDSGYWKECYSKYLESLVIQMAEVIKDDIKENLCQPCDKTCPRPKECFILKYIKILKKVYNKPINEIMGEK